ncbi:MAG: hypothetical protein OHK0046_16590 [Anaerolineae bacterium]
MGGGLGFILLTFLSPDFTTHTQMTLFVLSVFLLLWAGWPRGAAPPAALTTLLPITLVVLLAFLLRLGNLEYAIHRHVDELLSVDSVVQLRSDPYTPLLVPYQGVAAFPRLYAYIQLHTMPLFGATLTSLRLVSVILGTVGVAAVYRLALPDRRLGLLAALLLATLPPHLHFSRLGLNNIADPAFGTLALAFVLGERYILAGVMLGLTQYFYEGGRLLYPALLLAWAALHPQRWRGWVRLLGVFVLVAAPVYLTLLMNDLPLAPRLNATSHGAEWTVEKFWRALTFFAWQDASWFYGGAFVLAVPLVILGLFRWRDRVVRLAVLWLLITVLGNSLLRDPLEAPRYVVAYPALAVLMAAGVVQMGRWMAPYWRLPVTGVVVGGVMLLHTVYYFGVHIPWFLEEFRSPLLMDDIRFRTVDVPRNTHIHLITDEIVFPTDSLAYLQYVGHDSSVFITTIHPHEFNPELLDQLEPNRNHVFFVAREHTGLQLMLARSGLFEAPLGSPYGHGRYLMYHTPFR